MHQPENGLSRGSLEYLEGTTMDSGRIKTKFGLICYMDMGNRKISFCAPNKEYLRGR